MILNFCNGLLRQIRERQVVVAERLTSGTCKDYEEYKQQIGKLQGLKEAEELILEIYRNTFRTEIMDEKRSNNDGTGTIEFY